jgi:hypothetical protein
VSQQATADGSPQVPAVVSQYAAYLRAKAQVTPEITVNGDRADVRISIGDSAIVLAFRCPGNKEWALHSAEVQRGTQTATFTRGQLAHATAAFLSHEPSTSTSPSRKGGTRQ